MSTDRAEAAQPGKSTAGQPIHCTASVTWAPGEKQKLERIIVAAPKRDQVRMKILYTSICHTDVTAGSMEVFAPLFPVILGHEAVAVVESVGEGVTKFQAGDHVLPFMQGECGDCSVCTTGKWNACKERPINLVAPTLLGADQSHFTAEASGKAISTFDGLSTFSEYTVVHKDSIVKINSSAPLEKIGLVSCALATGFGSVWKVAKLTPGSTAAVFGLGAVGLAVVQACKLAGASRIIGVDINPSKVGVAKELGITDFINPKEHDGPVHKVIQEMTEGGVEYSFECVGMKHLVKEAVECTAMYGTTVLIGVPSSPLDTFELGFFTVLLGRTVRGSALGGITLKELPGIVEQGMRKEFEVDPYITHRLPFSKIGEAMEIFDSGSCLRCVLEMNRS